MKALWVKAYKKGKAAAWIKRFTSDITSKIQILGIRRKIEDVVDLAEVHWFIIMPTSVCKGVWNLIVVIILIYTATYMPYKTCFVDDDDMAGIIIDWTVDLLFISDIFV